MEMDRLRRGGRVRLEALQALEAVRQIALPPTADGMSFTGHLGGYLHIRWLLWCGSPEDEPTAKGQGLGCGMRSHKRLQLGVFVRGQGHRARKRNGHGPGPYRERGRRNMTRACLSFYTLFTQNVLAQDLRNGHLGELRGVIERGRFLCRDLFVPPAHLESAMP